MVSHHISYIMFDRTASCHVAFCCILSYFIALDLHCTVLSKTLSVSLCTCFDEMDTAHTAPPSTHTIYHLLFASYSLLSMSTIYYMLPTIYDSQFTLVMIQV